MTPAYDNFVSPRKWNIALLALAVTVIGGAALVVALLLGAANPPHATNLVYNANDANNLTTTESQFDGLQLFAFPDDLTPPFTIEIEASDTGAADSAWGVWLRVSDHYGKATTYPMMIDNRGYVLAALSNPRLEHHLFPPIRSGANRIAVDFDASGNARFRVNDELFSTLTFAVSTVQAGGIALYGDAQPVWNSIKIYTG